MFDVMLEVMIGGLVVAGANILYNLFSDSRSYGRLKEKVLTNRERLVALERDALTKELFESEMKRVKTQLDNLEDKIDEHNQR